MSCWSYKVKTAVYSCVHNVPAIQSWFIFKVTFKLFFNIIQNGFETDKEKSYMWLCLNI